MVLLSDDDGETEGTGSGRKRMVEEMKEKLTCLLC